MIIDTRMRPMYGAFAEQFTPEACAPFCRKIGMDMPESVRTASEKAMLEEMDAAGVSVGIAPSRFIPNDHLVEMVEHFKGRFVGMASIDSANTIKENLDIIKRYAVDGPLTGIHFEPGHSAVPCIPTIPNSIPSMNTVRNRARRRHHARRQQRGPTSSITGRTRHHYTARRRFSPGVNWFICHAAGRGSRKSWEPVFGTRTFGSSPTCICSTARARRNTSTPPMGSYRIGSCSARGIRCCLWERRSGARGNSSVMRFMTRSCSRTRRRFSTSPSRACGRSG